MHITPSKAEVEGFLPLERVLVVQSTAKRTTAPADLQNYSFSMNAKSCFLCYRRFWEADLQMEERYLRSLPAGRHGQLCFLLACQGCQLIMLGCRTFFTFH